MNKQDVIKEISSIKKKFPKLRLMQLLSNADIFEKHFDGLGNQQGIKDPYYMSDEKILEKLKEYMVKNSK